MKCPKCGKETDKLLALSRRDNKTMICNDCGVQEALEDLCDVRGKRFKKQATNNNSK